MKVRFANNIPTIKEIADLCGGRLVGDGGRAVTSVCTDSREAEIGAMFIAIVGERVDGHIFIEQVKKAGAVCIGCPYAKECAKKGNCPSKSNDNDKPTGGSCCH